MVMARMELESLGQELGLEIRKVVAKAREKTGASLAPLLPLAHARYIQREQGWIRLSYMHTRLFAHY